MQAVDVAVNAAVLEATARAVDKTKQEVEAANAAAKAVAEAQQLGELMSRQAALEEQLASTTEALHTAEASLLCVLTLTPFNHCCCAAFDGCLPRDSEVGSLFF